MPHPLASVQATLAAASKAAWDAVEADVRSRPPIVHAPGARLVLRGLDPTLQRAHEAGRAISIVAGDERFLVPLDAVQAHRMAHLRQLQTLFGWPVSRETTWHAVGEIVASRTLEPEELGPDAAKRPPGPVREHELTLHEIYVPDQVLLVPPASRGRVDEGWNDDATPGLDAAMEALDGLQGALTAPPDATPEVLLGLLMKLLATHHWRVFDGLCDAELSATDRRMAFEQFRQAWDASGGAITFEGQDGDPATIEVGGGLRTTIRRPGVKPGEVLVRPLRWVKRAEGWRYRGGIL